MESQLILSGLPALKDWLENQSFSQLFVLTDANTARYCYPLLKDKALGDIPHLLLSFQAGEENKNLQTCQMLWAQLLDAQADRKAIMLNLGGGVVGDLGGFVAATYKRGIRFVQVPTTLLSMVDAAHGGKLGIDFHQIKNSIGVFELPEAVVTDSQWLTTLNDRELISGFAEMIKHALIGGEREWQQVKQVASVDALRDMINDEHIAASAAIKQRITAADPYEAGLRQVLNFGHTVGHAIESFLLESPTPFLHGEAIAWGMVAETRLACLYYPQAVEMASALELLVRRLFPPLPTIATERVLEFMQNDKKNEKGQIRMALAAAPGIMHWGVSFRLSEIESVLMNMIEQ